MIERNIRYILRTDLSLMMLLPRVSTYRRRARNPSGSHSGRGPPHASVLYCTGRYDTICDIYLGDISKNLFNAYNYSELIHSNGYAIYRYR